VVTVTSTVPVPAGETAVIEVAELTVKLVALAEPNLTAVAPLKFVPVMLTEVPPVTEPSLGLTFVTTGEGLVVVLSVWSEPLLVPPALVAEILK